MSYEMNAEGLNGVKDTTTIVALPNWDPGTPQFPGATLLLVNGNGTNISANAVVGTGNLFGCGVQVCRPGSHWRAGCWC